VLTKDFFLATLAEEQLYWQDYADYPLEGQNMQNTLSGRRSGTLDTRQIFHRKRLINSQVRKTFFKLLSILFKI
jgi:hypothetical protein